VKLEPLKSHQISAPRAREFRVFGPFRDPQKRGQPKSWFLRYSAPELDAKGKPQTNADGKILVRRQRPYYESKALALADRERIVAQFGTTGSGAFVQSRAASEEYEQAKAILGKVNLVDAARFYLLHHPEAAKLTVEQWIPEFLANVKQRLGETRHLSDLKCRLNGAFLEKFGTRLPETIVRREILDFLLGLKQAGRTVLNTKRTICNFFSYLREREVISSNPAGGIKKRQLPKVVVQEIRFLSLGEAEKYLRAAERYDPEMVAHEIVQLIAGVRADDEMANFDGTWVLPETREIVIPAAIAKTGKREVINELEENFWAWWKAYGRKGILRPRNYGPRWDRLRILAAQPNEATADALAVLPIKTLKAKEDSAAILDTWPWNGRRRTFCTYHVAKHQSADKTALIMRHRGDTYTLHDSYRGLGVTQLMGQKYFEFVPAPVLAPIVPIVDPKGIVRIQKMRRLNAA
jgi:hypothetical protein